MRYQKSSCYNKNCSLTKACFKSPFFPLIYLPTYIKRKIKIHYFVLPSYKSHKMLRSDKFKLVQGFSHVGGCNPGLWSEINFSVKLHLGWLGEASWFYLLTAEWRAQQCRLLLIPKGVVQGKRLGGRGQWLEGAGWRECRKPSSDTTLGVNGAAAVLHTPLGTFICFLCLIIPRRDSHWPELKSGGEEGNCSQSYLYVSCKANHCWLRALPASLTLCPGISSVLVNMSQYYGHISIYIDINIDIQV